MFRKTIGCSAGECGDFLHSIKILALKCGGDAMEARDNTVLLAQPVQPLRIKGQVCAFKLIEHVDNACVICGTYL